MTTLVFQTPWWRHQMETFSALLAFCAGNSPVTGEFPSQRPVTRIFDVFFHLCLNKRLNKQSQSWWFETPWRPSWCHCNAHAHIQIQVAAMESSRIRYHFHQIKPCELQWAIIGPLCVVHHRVDSGPVLVNCVMHVYRVNDITQCRSTFMCASS